MGGEQGTDERELALRLVMQSGAESRGPAPKSDSKFETNFNPAGNKVQRSLRLQWGQNARRPRCEPSPLAPHCSQHYPGQFLSRLHSPVIE